MNSNNKTFKDFVNEDLNVFFNLDEFAEEHELDGEQLNIIVIDSKSDDNFTGYPREQLYASQEVYKSYKTIYVRSEDFYVPKVDSVITLDGEEFYVDEASEEMGVIRILVSSNES